MQNTSTKPNEMVIKLASNTNLIIIRESFSSFHVYYTFKNWILGTMDSANSARKLVPSPSWLLTSLSVNEKKGKKRWGQVWSVRTYHSLLQVLFPGCSPHQILMFLKYINNKTYWWPMYGLIGPNSLRLNFRASKINPPSHSLSAFLSMNRLKFPSD